MEMEQRNFDVDDCIYCIDKLATDKEIKGEILNIGPDDNFITINELFSKLSNQLNLIKELLIIKIELMR